MLTEQEAQDLMAKLVELRLQSKNCNDTKIRQELRQHEQICINKFKYLVTMKTGRYKTFSNYEDLNQEGFEALLKAMKTYNPKKGSFFAWAHHYIGTRISRSANLHTTIRYPLRVAKETAPHKEAVMPIIIEEQYCPDKQLENSQVNFAIQNAFTSLNDLQKQIISLAYGLEGDKPMSINKICKKLNISRLHCIKIMNNALSVMKDTIKL
jgi:RNA polymerase sigma factor (sigma-70 family)